MKRRKKKKEIEDIGIYLINDEKDVNEGKESEHLMGQKWRQRKEGEKLKEKNVKEIERGDKRRI